MLNVIYFRLIIIQNYLSDVAIKFFSLLTLLPRFNSRPFCLFQVRYTPWWIKGITLENTDGTECLWESRPGPEECQKDFGICMYRESGCYWTPSVPYKNCIKKYQLEREQKRAREP